jgi:transcriptional regulator NrdR family protein
MEMASSGVQQKQIAGLPADQCPFCNAAMFVDGVNRTEMEIVRYVECRNCKRRFTSYQPPAKLVREIRKDDSPDSKSTLTFVRDAS